MKREQKNCKKKSYSDGGKFMLFLKKNKCRLTKITYEEKWTDSPEMKIHIGKK